MALKFYSDDADLPKNDPTQLLEYTLGARIALPVSNPNTDPPNTLDLRNVDFDVSYVNIAYLPAAMGPVDNPKSVMSARRSPSTLQDRSQQVPRGLPRLAAFRSYLFRQDDGDASETSVAARDLRATGTHSSAARSAAAAALARSAVGAGGVVAYKWKKFAGTINAAGTCTATPQKDTFCDAVVDAKKLMRANYENYRVTSHQSAKEHRSTLATI